MRGAATDGCHIDRRGKTLSPKILARNSTLEGYLVFIRLVGLRSVAFHYLHTGLLVVLPISLTKGLSELS
jgi:hypothetical protein